MARGSSINISFTPHHKRLIDAKLASGGYHTASEVVREALRLMDAREQDQAWADIRANVAVARKEVDEGKGIPGDQARDEMTAYLRQRRPNKSHRTGRRA